MIRRKRSCGNESWENGGRCISPTELLLTIENRVGALAEVARILSEAKVNVTGLTLGKHPDERNLRLMVDDPETAISVLRRHGFDAREATVVSMRVKDRPGALARATEGLASKGINIEAVFVNLRPDKKFELVFQVDDPEKAKKVVKSLEEEDE